MKVRGNVNKVGWYKNENVLMAYILYVSLNIVIINIYLHIYLQWLRKKKQLESRCVKCSEEYLRERESETPYIENVKNWSIISSPPLPLLI